VAIHICCKRMFQFSSPRFSMLQQVLLSTRIDSRARKRCMQAVLPIFVMRASSNSRACMQRVVNAQTAEHFLVKVYVRMQSTRAGQHTMPNGRRTKGPAPPGVPPHSATCNRVNTWVSTLCSLSLMQLGGPHAHALLGAATARGGECSQKSKRGRRVH
jgi:hypothetical protein